MVCRIKYRKICKVFPCFYQIKVFQFFVLCSINLNYSIMKISRQTPSFANLSLISSALTVFLASITHAYIFGHRAFFAGFIFIFLLAILNIQYQRGKNKIFLFFYFLLNLFVIIGFGLLNGFWNHTIKVSLYYLHGSQIPPLFAGLFENTSIGTFFQESIGFLTFIASMFSAYYSFKMMQKKLNTNSELI